MFDRFMAWRGNRRSMKGRRAFDSRAGGGSRADKYRVPLIELLEQRRLLTGNSFTASPSVPDNNDAYNTATDATNSLRSALNAANADNTNTADTITLTQGTYGLTLGELSFDPGTAHSLTIVGNGSSGAGATIIDQLSL